MEHFETEALPLLPDVYRVALWLTRSKAEAEDLTQETYAQALRSFHRYEKGTNCKAWLMAILHNTNSKRLRKLSRLRIVDDSEEQIAASIAFDPPVPQDITDEDILAALRKLPEQYRNVVLLADVEELAYREVAGILDIPIGTVMSRLHRGRKLLRAELAACASAFGIKSKKLAAEN